MNVVWWEMSTVPLSSDHAKRATLMAIEHRHIFEKLTRHREHTSIECNCFISVAVFHNSAQCAEFSSIGAWNKQNNRE